MTTKSPSVKLPETEWHVPFRADSVPRNGRKMHIVADSSQLQSIAKRLDIKAVKKLESDIHLDLQNGGHILHITGHFTADIVQECVTTMEPVDTLVEDDFEAWYADHEKAVSFNRAKQQVKAIEEGDEVQMLEEKDDPEALIDGQVDLGEVVVQFLSLAINPYPRKEGLPDDVLIGQEAPTEKVAAATLRPNPFAALKNWRPKD